MKRVAFDIETNGLLDTLNTVHCMVITDLDTGQAQSFADQPGYDPVQTGLEVLGEADLIAGHNVIEFDLPALEKVYGWRPNQGQIVRDTIVLTRLIWPHVKDADFRLAAANRLPKNLIGSHSLKAWGWRLGTFKDEYDGTWECWTQTMHDYMVQDGNVTLALWRRCEVELLKWGIDVNDNDPAPRKDCVALEHRVAEITRLVTAHGFRFNQGKAIALVEQLAARRLQLTEELQIAFPPDIREEEFVPKVNNRTRGYVKGVPFIKRSTVDFNPGSRQQVAVRLQRLGWKPTEYGKDGVPTIDDDILNDLPYPQAKLLAEFYTVQKRLGQIVEGKEAWFRHVKRGRIHGRINSNGAHTGRATHANPNMAQVPKVGSPYGAECRECFEADEGHVLIGCDQDGLEARCLGAYCAPWDGGAMVETLLNGDKSKGTDFHTVNSKLLECSRDVAKVFVYAMMYGAGDMKLGETLGLSGRKAMAAGKAARQRLMVGLPALNNLIKGVQAAVNSRGYLVGLDGRRLYVRSENAALNTLLQSAGAVICKRWIVALYDAAKSENLKWGSDWAIVAWVHDELQITCLPSCSTPVSNLAVAAAQNAGTFYNFNSPTTGNADTGSNWAQTH